MSIVIILDGHNYRLKSMTICRKDCPRLQYSRSCHVKLAIISMVKHSNEAKYRGCEVTVWQGKFLAWLHTTVCRREDLIQPCLRFPISTTRVPHFKLPVAGLHPQMNPGNGVGFIRLDNGYGYGSRLWYSALLMCICCLIWLQTSSWAVTMSPECSHVWSSVSAPRTSGLSFLEVQNIVFRTKSFLKGSKWTKAAFSFTIHTSLTPVPNLSKY